MRDRLGHRLVGFIATAAILAGQVFAGPLDETRYCQITPKRDRDGSITRRADVIAAFKRHHPCPSTGKTSGPCKGWAIDHVIPLANGGCDSVHNLQWLPHKLKSCARICKDRWERKVYRPVQSGCNSQAVCTHPRPPAHESTPLTSPPRPSTRLHTAG